MFADIAEEVCLRVLCRLAETDAVVPVQYLQSTFNEAAF